MTEGSRPRSRSRPYATENADRFAYERIGPLLASAPDDGGAPPFALIATDGELYGHHQPHRDMFLARLVGDTDLGYEVATLADVVRDDGRPFPVADLVEDTSWSCHHGVARWREACDCVGDGAWKAPLRAALDRLAEAVDTQTELIARDLPGAPDPWAARDDYVDVVIGAVDEGGFAARWLGPSAGEEPQAPLPRHDGRPALAPRDVRELRLVLGVAGSTGDRPRHPGRRARRPADRRPVRLLPRGSAVGRPPGGPVARSRLRTGCLAGRASVRPWTSCPAILIVAPITIGVIVMNRRQRQQDDEPA